jgi:nanoRNase/pAp phosphatase (c-di-AMP/oligoRNAs hydrolase)
LFYILKELWLEKYIEKQEATLLIAWILTDTNVFYNTNTSSKTLLTCSKLLELWADLRNSIYTFFYAQNFNKLKLKAIIFENIQKSEDWKIVWSKITKSDFEKTQTAENDTSWIISELINIEWCEIAFIIYPFFEKNKVSFRSKNFDVWTFSANFEWWWHTLAAWFSSEKSIEELEKEVLEKLSKEIKVY